MKKRSKIGIITFHRANNYGAVLQAFALQKVIEESGADCHIIDYRNKWIENAFHSYSLKAKIKNIIKIILFRKRARGIKEKNAKFEEFRKNYLNLSKKYIDYSFKDDFDAIVAGSDQVWNKHYFDEDKVYFLPYKEGAKKYSYSASFGSDVYEKPMNNLVDYLKDFESIFVREDSAISLIKKISSDLNATKTIDPTLLLNIKEWSLVEKPFLSLNHKKYILLYFVASPTNSIEVAKTIAKKIGASVVLINAPRKKYDGIISYFNVGPEEFVWLIKNAAMVITTSYHGLLFSINFNTPFLFELNKSSKNANSRLEEIAKTFSISEFEIDNRTDYPKDYDWKRINGILSDERERSIRLIDLNIVKKV